MCLNLCIIRSLNFRAKILSETCNFFENCENHIMLRMHKILIFFIKINIYSYQTFNCVFFNFENTLLKICY